MLRRIEVRGEQIPLEIYAEQLSTRRRDVAGPPPTLLGPTLDAAVEVTCRMSPATSGLDESDPELGSVVRSSIAEALRKYDGPAGVQTDSAAWLVTARSAR